MPPPQKPVMLNYEWLTPDQIKERWPLIETGDLKGAIYHTENGYINPADVTQAMAKGARVSAVLRSSVRCRLTPSIGPVPTGKSPAPR